MSAVAFSSKQPEAAVGYTPVVLDWRVVARAKRMMRSGLDLYEAAMALGVRARDLDVSLWQHIGSEGWV